MVATARTARTARAVAALLLVLAAVGCTRSDPAPRAQAVPLAAPTTVPAPPPPPPPPPKSVVATASVPSVAVFSGPAEAVPSSTLTNPNDLGEPRVFLVKQAQGDWLEVFLPARPNGSTGWVRASDVVLSENEWRLKVELSSYRLTVWKGADLVREETVAVGKATSPTPTGDFYVTESLETGNPRGPYGTWAFGLSAYSDVYTSFAGGPGQVGIHGTHDLTSLGRSASAGCVRLTDPAIIALAAEVPVGTPVSIVA